MLDEARSHIKFKRTIVADQLSPFRIDWQGEPVECPRLWRIPRSMEELCPFIDRAQIRSMGRTSAILLHLIHEAGVRERITGLRPERIGIYVAANSGQTPFPLVEAYHSEAQPRLMDVLRRKYAPKRLLQANNGLCASWIGIQLATRGPTFTSKHPIWGGFQAVDRAADDFANDRIDLAILGSAVALEDPFEELEIGDTHEERRECGVIVGAGREAMASLASEVRQGTRGHQPCGIAASLLRLGENV